jgi:agmatine deiminase
MLTSTTSRATRLPAEWERHAATIVAWPGRPSVWEDHLSLGQAETMQLIQRVTEAEPVIVAASPVHYRELARKLDSISGTTLVTVPLDDCWARDISPVFTLSENRENPTAIDFRFNAWGEKFKPYSSDANFGQAFSEKLGFDRIAVELVMEGGSITTDGCGTAIIVEPTILNINRNPGIGKEEIEEIFSQYLGIETVIWIPFGLLGDTDTDGHVDNVVVFCGQGRIMVQVPPSPGHRDTKRLTANIEILTRARDSSGRQFEVVEVPWLPVSQIDASRPCSYVNVYPTNTSVLVPTVGTASDDLALELISEAFGGRSAIPILSNALSYAGGGPHCMTMQVPACMGESKRKGEL